jgi:hypothetical protein
MRKTRYLTHVQTSTPHTGTKRDRERETFLVIYLRMINRVFISSFNIYVERTKKYLSYYFLIFLERKKMSIQNKERKKKCLH